MTNDINNTASLGELVREARTEKGLSLRELAERSDIAKSTLLDMEQGKIASPKPAVLRALSQSLDVPLPDLQLAAGYNVAGQLPSFTPYLRSKYSDLPREAQRELERSFAHIAEKYGYDDSGPEPGEDEN